MCRKPSPLKNCVLLAHWIRGEKSRSRDDVKRKLRKDSGIWAQGNFTGSITCSLRSALSQLFMRVALMTHSTVVGNCSYLLHYFFKLSTHTHSFFPLSLPLYNQLHKRVYIVKLGTASIPKISMAFCASIETPNRFLSSTHHLLYQSSSLVNYLSKIIISLSLPLSYALSSSSSPSKTFTESEARSRSYIPLYIICIRIFYNQCLIIVFLI